MVLSAAMMLRLSFNLPAEALAVEKAVQKVLADGARTPDLILGGRQAGIDERDGPGGRLGDLVAPGVRRRARLAAAQRRARWPAER